jgi:hypothetical protein
LAADRARAWLRLAALLLALLALGLSASAQPYLPAPHPGFNQAYRVGAGAWGDCGLGTQGCPDRISGTGCLVSSMSTILDYYGIELAVSSRESCLGHRQDGMNPGILNDWLRAHNGFGACASDPMGLCCLAWGQLPEVAVAFSANASERGLDPASRARIDAALRAGHPVVAGVHWAASCGGGRGTEDCHWVVITGREGNTYMIVDPFNPEMDDPQGIRTTLENGVLGRYVVDRFAEVIGPVEQVVVPSVAVRLSGGRAGRYGPGDAVRLNVEVRDARVPLRSFVRLAAPDGQRFFLPRPTRGTRLGFGETTTEWIAFHTEPTAFATGSRPWVDLPVDRMTEGTWWWEVWVEDPMHPGSVIASARASFVVSETPVAVSPSLAAIGILLVMAALAAALLLTGNP